MEIIADSLCRHCRRQLEMRHRHALGSHATSHIIHTTGAHVIDGCQNLDSTGMSTPHDIDATADKQNCHRKQHRQDDVAVFLYCGCKDNSFSRLILFSFLIIKDV